MAGVTPTGFVKRSLEDLLAQVEDRWRSQVSAVIDVSSSSPVGQMNAIFLEPISELWDLAQDEYTAMDPDKNADDAQDAIAAITGARRLPATKSYARLTLGLDATTTVPRGSLVAVDGNASVIFKLIGSEAVTGTVVDEDVTSTTAGSYYGRFECLTTGAVIANAGTLTQIVTAVTGWNSVTNALDAVTGRDIEENSDFRIRREDELQAIGSTPVDALRGELLAVTGIQQAIVFENVLDVVDPVTGLYPHSIECLIYDGPSPAVADNDIAQVIWDGKAGGIQTYGTSTGFATDSLGNSRAMNFSRPTPMTVYFDITLTRSSSGYPGDTAVKNAIVAYATTVPTALNMGDDVILAAFYGAIFGVGGVANITSFKAGFSPSPSGTTDLTIGLRELATFDTGRITIHS